jgi:hypothetical protein
MTPVRYDIIGRGNASCNFTDYSSRYTGMPIRCCTLRLNNEAECPISLANPANPERGNAALIVSPGNRVLFVVRFPSPVLPPKPATMSGFEAVGVVLGSMPLLAIALEHYLNGVRN